MHLEAVFKRVYRCTWRPWSCDHGGCNRVSLEIHLEAVFKQNWRYALGGHDHASFEAVLRRVWRYTWRPQSNECGDTLGGRDRASLEMHLEVVTKRVCTSTGMQSMDSAPGAETLFISWLTHNWGNVTRRVYLSAFMESWLMAVDHVGRHAGSWSYIQRWTCNDENEGKTHNLWWMLYSVYAVLSACYTHCQLMIMTWRDREGWLNFVFRNDSRVVDEKERYGGWSWERCGGLRGGMRKQGYNLPDSVWMTSDWCNYMPEQDPYLLYRGW